MKTWLISLIVVALCALPALAQDDDKGFITTFLEESLAGEGRTVEINGFRGALSRRATVSSIEILDDDGPWLRMTDLSMQLNRSALLRGRVEIDELSAATIDFSRLPNSPESNLPPAKAQGFSLPELPVSVEISTLRADKILLGKQILGEAAELSLKASLSLIDGKAIARLSATRTDQKFGIFEIDVSFVGEDEYVDLDIQLEEGTGGIVARLLALPGNPSTSLSILGSGPLDDLTAEIDIATDGSKRLGGQVKLSADRSEGEAVSRNFAVDVSGDVTALFAPQYRPFFGDNVALIAKGTRQSDGRLNLRSLDLSADAMTLNGQVLLDSDFWPVNFDVRGKIAHADNSSVTLPISGPEVRAKSIDLDLQFDQEKGDGWVGDFTISEFERDGLTVEKINLAAAGALNGSTNSIGALTADLNLKIAELQTPHEGLAKAVGRNIDGSMRVDFNEGQPLKLEGLRVSGSGYELTGSAKIDDLAGGLETRFNTELQVDALGQFSALLGRDLGGAAMLALKGTADLGGSFNIEAQGKAESLSIGQDQADDLLSGTTKLTLAAERDQSGTRIDRLNITNQHLNVIGSGTLTGEDADLSIEATLNDASRLAPQLSGPISVGGQASQRDGNWSLDVSTDGPIGARANITGLATGPRANLEFNALLPDIAPLAPAYSGALALDGRLFVVDGAWNIETGVKGPYGLTANAQGQLSGQSAPDLRVSANLPNVAPLVPKVNGPLSLQGTLRAAIDDRWAIFFDIDGPSGTRATVEGNVSPSGTLNINVGGSAQLALANPFLSPRSVNGDTQFDFRINGPADLSSVSGSVAISNARAVAPNLSVTLEDISADIGLSNGRATLDLRAQPSRGGTLRINGPVELTGLMPANLRIGLEGVVIEDPTLYRTLLDGTVGIDGSLLANARISGLIEIGDTLISVPSSGISSFGTIPNITHIGAPAEVRRTLQNAGLTQKASSGNSGSKTSYPLDLTISAPRQIFVRGRGLDAELGGRLRLAGTTANIISSGRFELVRGRLDILSKRFDLDEGIVQLQGDFDPFLKFVATTPTAGGSASVVVEGSASDPQVRFESSPAAPQDEVLAQIFFGRDVSQISALQALQLASAVATLAGRGGEGIVSKLRRGFDLDDLDITTDEQGNAGLRAGKYISDNVYTDVTIGTETGPEVSLNIDLTPSIKATGKLGSDGDTSIGIFFEKDY